MQNELPLAGVRIADFSWVLAGPHSTEWLGALGAEVIKVESHFRPDRFRGVPPFIGGPESLDGSVAFNMLNYSKTDCTINLGTKVGCELARQLIDSSDVMIENFSSGVIERLGLSFDALRSSNPQLVMVSCSGLGRTGPDAGMRAFGKSIHAFTGHTYLTRWPHTPPRGVGGTWTDPNTGAAATLAILAGLAYVRRTGQCLHFDLSMAETTISLMSEAFLQYFGTGLEPEPVGNISREAVPHNTYCCADGRWAAIAVHDRLGWSGLSNALDLTPELRGLTEIEAREGLREEIDALVNRWCAVRTRDAVITSLREAGVSCTKVNEIQDVLTDEHFVSRQLITELHCEGLGAYHAVKLPWRQEPEVRARYEPAPKLGQDNDYVFKKVLGLSDDQIEALTERNVLV